MYRASVALDRQEGERSRWVDRDGMRGCPNKLEVLGWEAHFSARPEAAIAVRQRAFASVRDADPTRAALIALHIALVQLGRNALAVGAGWVQQATNLLVDQGECEAATWLAWAQALMASELGETEFALAAADEVIGLAAVIGVPMSRRWRGC